jgi:hypothetical protein
MTLGAEFAKTRHARRTVERRYRQVGADFPSNLSFRAKSRNLLLFLLWHMIRDVSTPLDMTEKIGVRFLARRSMTAGNKPGEKQRVRRS